MEEQDEWAKIYNEIDLLYIYMDFYVYKLIRNIHSGLNLKEGIISFEEFKQLEYNDSTNIWGKAGQKFMFHEYWKEIIMK